MARDQGRLNRKHSGQQRYKNRIVIATEGKNTEKNYLVCCLGGKEHPYTLEFVPTNCASAPSHVLQRMERQLRKKPLETGDHAWLLVDRDGWEVGSLRELSKWALGGNGRHLALSNPKFEYWLLLHFERGSRLKGSEDCDLRLLKHWPNYTKSTKKMEHLRGRIGDAVSNARQRDTPPCDDWPQTSGSTVYRLVEQLLHYLS